MYVSNDSNKQNHYIYPYCRPKPVNCRPAHVHSRPGPVTYCRPEPLCVVTDIPKHEIQAAQPRSDAFFLPEPCYMLLSCTLIDLHPLLFIQVSAYVLPLKCLRGECCWVFTFVTVKVEVVLKWPKISVILFHSKNGFFGHKFPIKCIQM